MSSNIPIHPLMCLTLMHPSILFYLWQFTFATTFKNNGTSLPDMAHHKFRFLIICKLLRLLAKVIEVVYWYVLKTFNFRDVLLLRCKPRFSSPAYSVIQSIAVERRDRHVDFSGVFLRNCMQQSRRGFELSSSIPFSAPMTLMSFERRIGVIAFSIR